MIADRIENLAIYLPGSCKEKILSFVSGIAEKIPADGEYPIEGESMFARVQSYPLLATKKGRCEAHRRYIDIQSAIKGAERIDVFDCASLTEPECGYDAKTDAIFYHPGEAIYSLALRERCFAVLFPHEAHRPQMPAGEIRYVKKFVIKVGVELWNSSR